MSVENQVDHTITFEVEPQVYPTFTKGVQSMDTLDITNGFLTTRYWDERIRLFKDKALVYRLYPAG
jgi:hypothetical protein